MTAEVTASRRRATGRTLLIVSALGAAGFAGWSLAQLQLASTETFLSDAWHAFGLIVFAGLFALVAWRPRAYPGLMELTIVHSVGMFVLAFTNQDAAGATATMILHGLLALALLIAYVVLGCVKAWGRQPAAAHTSPGRTGSPDATGSPAVAGKSGAKKDSAPDASAKQRQSRESTSERGQRSLERTPEAPAQPGGTPNAQPGEASPTKTQPTRPISQELPEDRPRR
ncbi:hypothetical protein [Nesterenkonia jeotgali]|uniref:Uncharacterized protein n=1 Tax=Nesterenkonia jeotgali TaxID=317018 RepID=A0A0W8IJ20_9MICC|nr:hypothetical protein [Nesterenkonia jeotgali]KUG59803.1 hypothetical protein AVL63_12070 [Nesterenkonia jeotgali]MBA8921858.1 hypothetical protein [Nesterenkonia jeotgali]